MNVGLILAGGMAKGAYQIGALRAIGEYLKPDNIRYISAASVGVINAACFSGKRLDYEEEQWRSMNDSANRIFLTTLFKSSFFERIVSETAGLSLCCEKLYAPVLDLSKREVLYPDLLRQNETKRALYIRASMAFPPFCKAVQIEGRSYYDGALADNIPFYPLIKCKPDYVICIYFDNYQYVFESKELDDRTIRISFPEDRLFLADSLWFTKERTAEMIDFGYQKAKSVLNFVFRGGTEDVEMIEKQIKAMELLEHRKKKILTGDMIINNVNRVVARFSKRKMLN